METNTAENVAAAHAPMLTSREERGRQIAKLGGIKQLGSRYVVPSQSGATTAYFVDIVEECCNCPDWELHGRNWQCKHVHAVYYAIAWSADVDANGTVTQTVTVKVKRKTYPRDWKGTNDAQTNEGPYVERLLQALCEGLEEPARKPGPGRPPMPLHSLAFASILKVYIGKSQRLVQSDLVDSVAKGTLDRVGHFNRISDFLGEEDSTRVLVKLIEESAKPLAAIENAKGQFAIDSTGFSTVTYDRWFDQKHGKLCAKHPWVKLHIVVGTATHVITSAKVSPEGDCPVLPELTAQTMKNFTVREMSGDKAYSSKDNREVLDRVGVAAFIPFKIDAVIDPKREVWSRQLCEFLFNQDKFLPHYHRRSNVETVMWMIKSKFGGSVDSKKATAQVNEVLAKCLCHNLCCLVRAIFTAGLAPKFWQEAVPAPTPRPTLTLVPMPEN